MVVNVEQIQLTTQLTVIALFRLLQPYRAPTTGMDGATNFARAAFGPEVDDPYPGEARLMTAVCAGVRVASVYVPNGEQVGSIKYAYKLAWLERLHAFCASLDAAVPTVSDRRT